jgi:ABC-type sugar transport system permease subunit
MLDFDYGAALGVVVFAMVMTVAWIYLRFLSAETAT